MELAGWYLDFDGHVRSVQYWHAGFRLVYLQQLAGLAAFGALRHLSACEQPTRLSCCGIVFQTSLVSFSPLHFPQPPLFDLQWVVCLARSWRSYPVGPAEPV
jgi:hypothetical protein